MVKRIVKKRDIRTMVYGALRNYIVSDEVPLGGKIDENELANSLGVSKTPVREALSKLAHDGLVKIIPNKGAFKVKLSREDILEIMTIRIALDALAIRLAMPNLTAPILRKLRDILAGFDEDSLPTTFLEFPKAIQAIQSLIYSATKSPRLIRILQSMRDLAYIVAFDYFRTPERVEVQIKRYKRLFDAMESGDVDLAESVRKEMVFSHWNDVMSQM